MSEVKERTEKEEGRESERRQRYNKAELPSHLTGVGESGFQYRSIHQVRRDSMLRCYHPLLFVRLTFHLPVFWILLVLLVFNLTKHNRYKKNGNTVIMGRIEPIYLYSILMSSSRFLVFKVTTLHHKILYAIHCQMTNPSQYF